MELSCWRRCSRNACFVTLLLLALTSGAVFAGGGVILRDDICIIEIGFYDAHFTAYQPNTSGNTEYCEDLPDTGETLFVLDYLHSSLREVPVDFRIINDVTGAGEFVRLEQVQAIENLDSHTVFYREPAIASNGSYRVDFKFLQRGEYIGVVTAGHPTNDNTYSAVFPFTVGRSAFPYWMLYLLAATLFVLIIRYAYASMRDTSGND